MQWINHFSKNRIPFYIYKLNKGDSIIYSKDQQNSNSSIILDGTVYLLKIFTNKEITSLGIFKKDNILSEIQNASYYYYTIVALESTFLLSFKLQDLFDNTEIQSNLLQNFIISYKNTLDNYAKMNHIYAHKYAKHRFIQLILFLSKEFGLLDNNQIIIPFHISQITISIIIGSNRSTVNQIINKLDKIHMVSYHNQKYICITHPFILNYYNL